MIRQQQRQLNSHELNMRGKETRTRANEQLTTSVDAMKYSAIHQKRTKSCKMKINITESSYVFVVVQAHPTPHNLSIFCAKRPSFKSITAAFAFHLSSSFDVVLVAFVVVTIGRDGGDLSSKMYSRSPKYV